MYVLLQCSGISSHSSQFSTSSSHCPRPKSKVCCTISRDPSRHPRASSVHYLSGIKERHTIPHDAYIQSIQKGRNTPAMATLALLAMKVPLPAALLKSEVVEAVEVIEAVTTVPFTPVTVLLAPPVPVKETELVVVFAEPEPLPVAVEVDATQLSVKKT